MTATGTRDSLEFVREIRATPERIFRAFTTPEDLLEWWGKHGWPMTAVQVDLRPGGRYRLDFRNPTTGESVSITGEYQVVDPPRRLAMTWVASRYPALTNRVELTLEPIAGGTRLTLRHSGLAANPEAYTDYETGWVEVLGHLAAWASAFAAALSTSQGAPNEA